MLVARIVALFAIIALFVNGIAMADARPMPMPMPTMAHAPGTPAPPCNGVASALCDICCIVAPATAMVMPDRLAIRPRFTTAPGTASVGLAVRPTPPPPRTGNLIH